MLAILLLSLAGLVTSSLASENATHSQDQRFIDNGDMTITDTKSDLMWLKQDSYQHTGHWLNWFEAFKYVKELNEKGFANHRDWQVPTIKELQTLYEPHKLNSRQVGSEMNIHIDPIFAKKGSGSHWAAEANGNYNAFGVVFNTGNRFNSSKKNRGRKVVRAVRSAGP
jgi:hypothetical protein